MNTKLGWLLLLLTWAPNVLEGGVSTFLRLIMAIACEAKYYRRYIDGEHWRSDISAASAPLLAGPSCTATQPNMWQYALSRSMCYGHFGGLAV